MSAVDAVNEVSNIGSEGFKIFLLFVVAGLLIWEVFDKLKVRFGKTHRELKDESVDARLKELDEKIDNEIKKVKESLFEKQEVYHHQSEEIRDDFIKRQDESRIHREKLQAGQDSLAKNVNDMMTMLQEYIKKDNEKTVATLRTSLWRMHKDFVDQEFVTPDGLKTFMEEGKVYEAAGGNDIYHEKLLPEVLDLEIHYPDGSVYNHKHDE